MANDDSRLHFRAKVRGYELRRSSRPLGDDNQGGYRIVNLETLAVAAGPQFELDADAVSRWLEKAPETKYALLHTGGGQLTKPGSPRQPS